MLKADQCWKKWENGWRKPAEAQQLFPTFLPKDFFNLFSNFVSTFSRPFWQRFNTTLFYHCFCFVCYAVQSSSLQYKTLSPFLRGGGCVKAIPRTALLLSKTSDFDLLHAAQSAFLLSQKISMCVYVGGGGWKRVIYILNDVTLRIWLHH